MATPASVTVKGQIAFVAISTASTRALIPTTGAPTLMRVYNVGVEPVFVLGGDNTVVATVATGMPISPGTAEYLTISPSTYLAAITAVGSSGVVVTTST